MSVSIPSNVEGEQVDLSQQPLMRDPRCPFDPAAPLQQLQRDTPITAFTLPTGVTTWLVTRHRDAKALLGDPRVSSDPMKPGFASVERPAHGSEEAPIRFFIQMDDPEHAEVRLMATGPFTVKSVRAAQPRILEVVDSLIDDLLASEQPADFVEKFALALPTFMICDILGAPYSDRHVFHDATQVMASKSSSPEAKAAAQASLQQYLVTLFQQKAENPGDDLFSTLSGYVAEGKLSMPEVIGMGIMLLIAGHETTANTTSLGLLALLQNPDQLQLMRDNVDDPKFMAGAIEELLRYTSVVREPMRRAIVEDIDYEGVTLKAGDGLMVPLDIANRDPEAFENPHQLDLTRKARHHITFGFGVHQCVGQQLARVELITAFTQLIKRIPTLQLAIPAASADFKHDALVYALNELPVRW